MIYSFSVIVWNYRKRINKIDDLKKQAIKQIKKLGYENKKLKQLNDELTKQKRNIEGQLNDSKSQTAQVIKEYSEYKKIISGQKIKIIDEGLVETDAETEMPKSLEKKEIIFMGVRNVRCKVYSMYSCSLKVI